MLKLISLIIALIFPQPLTTPVSIVVPTPTPDNQITLLVTGDVLPARTINARSRELKNFVWPWEATRVLLKSADITYINLETPILTDCPTIITGTTFCGDPRSIEGLIYAGVDVANLANNHIYNYGQTGVESTVDLLEKSGIKTTGITNPALVKIKGQQIAFLGFNAIPLTIPRSVIGSEISAANKLADFVVVQFHWGTEYTTEITDQQRELAQLAVDSGADLVVGNHPHWVQPEEIYKNKIIKYAHGNFIFDQFWSTKTLEGEIGRYVISDGQLIAHDYLPVKIDNTGQPHLNNAK
jgi:gamma-polyglutamate biosynthesis protein CapA